ncbi:MAG: nickel pincer cofactor biosynthesis protein LarB [Chitinophagales bacterium]
MKNLRLKEILASVAQGTVSIDGAMELLKNLPYENLGFARIDHHRALRDNFPEVIFGPGKTMEEVVAIVESMSSQGHNIIVTRASDEVFAAVQTRVAEARFNERAKLVYIINEVPVTKGKVTIVTAGTGDIPVAEEAAISLEVMGASVTRIYDAGVAGIHRILDRLNDLTEAHVVIVAAGMEGALASVVGGLTARPVIAVPTSIGYGTSFRGLAALLSMLNTCAPGVGVVNIDNGYGAAALAWAIINTTEK